jgi:hypothetical protein
MDMLRIPIKTWKIVPILLEATPLTNFDKK